jgi:segregation and condensation protein B
MTGPELKAALEAVLMVTEDPLDHVSLGAAVDAPPAAVEEALDELAAEYTEQGRGFELRRVATGWRFSAREEYAAVVQRFAADSSPSRLSSAAQETLTVVAYRQPVTRARIAAIRGVSVDSPIRTLVARGLVEEVGAEPESGAHLYATTSRFLEALGLSTIEELPEIAPFLPEMAELDADLELRDAVDGQ